MIRSTKGLPPIYLPIRFRAIIKYEHQLNCFLFRENKTYIDTANHGESITINIDESFLMIFTKTKLNLRLKLRLTETVICKLLLAVRRYYVEF